ncbi:hypothetical protein SLA2020_081690 [Shorea laevis]
MALSSGIFSTTAITPKMPSLSSRRLLPATASPPPANVCFVRTVIQAAASKSATGTRLPSGIMRPRRVSPEMEALVGVSEIPRTQALKRIWAYIKENNLQDPENKKIIICDEKLKKIFGGKDRVGFLEVGGLITPHFL